jgi:hypothetical protein
MYTVYNSAHIFCIFSVQKARKCCTPKEPIDYIVRKNAIKLHHRGQEKKEHAQLFFLFGQCSLIIEKEFTTCGPSTSTEHCSVRLSPIVENSPYYRTQMYCLGKKKHGQEEEHVSLHQESVCHTTWLSKVGQL